MMFKPENCHKHYYGSSLNIKRKSTEFLENSNYSAVHYSTRCFGIYAKIPRHTSQNPIAKGDF